MFRLIVLIALVLAATYLIEAVIRRVRRELGDPGGPASRGRQRMRNPVDAAGFGPQSTTVAPGDRLVACAGCGVHTPYSRAWWFGKVGPFCSEACRQRAKTAS